MRGQCYVALCKHLKIGKNHFAQLTQLKSAGTIRAATGLCLMAISSCTGGLTSLGRHSKRLQSHTGQIPHSQIRAKRKDWRVSMVGKLQSVSIVTLNRQLISFHLMTLTKPAITPLMQFVSVMVSGQSNGLNNPSITH